MEQFDLCQYVDVFYGNGETDRFFEDGLASKWFYIKALCGNTVPHAVLPFGKMSVGAYSGGYPTGYGTHYPNCCGGIRKLGEVQKAKGFSHLHHSGTGGIRYYYNYAVTSPFYGPVTAAQEERVLADEEARPGYYKAELQDIRCELTVDGSVAVHRYTFGRAGGRVAVDFSNAGLAKDFGPYAFSEVLEPNLEITGENEVLFSGIFYGVRLYFCVEAEGTAAVQPFAAGYGAVFDVSGDTALMRVGYSTISPQHAKEAVHASGAPFDEIADGAYRLWNESLSRVSIQTDDETLKRKFYSNLYHSLIKPCDMTGETVLGVTGDTVTDLATFWDQYKTALPLIYLCYPEMGEKIVQGIVNISRTLGKIPCSFGLSDIFPCEEQAKMLGILTLCDAHYMGIRGAAVEVIEECIQRELEREDYGAFLKTGFFDRYTHILDVTDACFHVARLTKDPRLKTRLLALAQCWKNAYGEDALMSGDSKYYEGDRYTYSFRLQANMEERIALAGGKEKFAAMLDRFFGFEGESLRQIRDLDADRAIGENGYHRFQGFNNECDMETPYAYLYADRHDRLCEIVRECVHRSFGTGTGALPGNNDSGGLSSLFVFNALGIFPANGTGDFLLGAPQIESADIMLTGGKRVEIRVSRQQPDAIYVERAEWNGKRLDAFRIPMGDLMQGGTLHFFMK